MLVSYVWFIHLGLVLLVKRMDVLCCYVVTVTHIVYDTKAKLIMYMCMSLQGHLLNSFLCTLCAHIMYVCSTCATPGITTVLHLLTPVYPG